MASQEPPRKSGGETRPLLAIDGDSLAHRSFHALPKSIRRRDGGGGGAIVGFANFLIRLHESERPRAVVVAWDMPGAPNFRQRLFAPYQGGRDFDPDLIDQLAILPDFVTACGFVSVSAPGYEADDFLAAAATTEEHGGGTALVATGDRDAFQLASARTTVLYPVKAGEMAKIGPAEVHDRYGVAPAQVADFIALRGDPSDKIPGARGVGPKRAAALLQQFGSLDAILAAGHFADQADDLRLFRTLATMDSTARLPVLRDHEPQWGQAAGLAREWGLNQLARRLADLASQQAT